MIQMNKQRRIFRIANTLEVITFFLIFSPLSLLAHQDSIQVTLHLRGVYQSDIKVESLLGTNAFKSVVESDGIKNGETRRLVIPKEILPGEFILRFDYKEKIESTPYPSEKKIFINNQDLELWVSPMYSNNPDSTWFQKDEKENTLYAQFSRENSHLKEKLSLLQSFLMNYDDTNSKMYQICIQEYEKRRQSYNDWLKMKEKQDQSLFISNLYQFQFVSLVNWKGSEDERINSMINHYFDGVTFKDPLIIRTSQLIKWMDNYVNLYGKKSLTKALRDSLLPEAGRNAVEKAKQGHPLVYGWMVDYFYRGYETNSITSGMKILEPYMNDPTCLTTKRLEIERRLKGIETLVPGSKAPDIVMNDLEGGVFDLNSFETPEQFILLLFWSAGCNHCTETINSLYPWWQKPEVKEKIGVVDISLDETETEINEWGKKVNDLKGWKHLHDKEGVRSKVASDYFVLATPVMVLLDSKTKKIVGLPDNLYELQHAFDSR